MGWVKRHAELIEEGALIHREGSLDQDRPVVSVTDLESGRIRFGFSAGQALVRNPTDQLEVWIDDPAD